MYIASLPHYPQLGSVRAPGSSFSPLRPRRQQQAERLGFWGRPLVKTRHVHEGGKPLRAWTSEGTEKNSAAVVEEC
jgi:hypothetical protein